jgi:predicted DCC family thiol-disulfide oxidoreductase YuxK
MQRTERASALDRIQGHDVIVFDGVCVLCSGFMRFVIRHDSAQRYRFVIAQSPLGEALYAATGLKSGVRESGGRETGDYDTNLVFRDGQLHQRLDAFIVVMGDMGWPWRAAILLRPLPQPIKDWLYDRIARNRYRMFGRTEMCLVPDATVKARFLD